MLKNMRDNLKHYKWVLLLVVLSFGISIFFWDTGVNWTGSIRSSWAAEVNGEVISADAYQQAFRNQVQMLSQFFGDAWDPKFVLQKEVSDQILNGLVERKVAIQEARRVGLTATPAEILWEVRKNSVFLDDEGKFVGVRRYQDILRRSDIRLADFERNIADQIALDKFENLLRSSVVVSDEDVDRAVREDKETASIEYVLVQPSDVASRAEEPDEATLQAWYDAHKDRFLQPEERRVSYIHLGQAKALEKVGKDDEMRAYYEQHYDRFSVPVGSRMGRQILGRVSPDAKPEVKEGVRRFAEDLVRRLKNGEDFAELARRYSNDPSTAFQGGDLGWFAKGELPPALDKAFFEMSPMEIRGPIETPLGFHVIQLTDEADEDFVRPYSEVRGEIGAILYFKQMQDWINDKAAEIRKEADAGADMDSLASRMGVQVETVTVPAGEGIRELGDFPEVRQAVAGATGEIQGPITAMNGDQAFVEVVGVVEPHAAPLEDVRDKVLAAWKEDRSRELARAVADELAEKAKGGTSLDDAASEQGLSTETAEGFTRKGKVGSLGDQPVLRASAFSMAEGDVGPVLPHDDGFIVFRLTGRKDLDDAALAEQREPTRRRLENTRFQMLLEDVLGNLKDRATIRVNAPFISAVKDTYLQRAGVAQKAASTS